MTPLRVGLIGLGSMGRNHARILSDLPGVELVGISDSQFAGKHFNGVGVLSTVEDLVRLRLDYAVIATPTSQHLPVASQLARAGIPALIEKPLAPSTWEAAELVHLYLDAGVLAAVGHIERFNAAYQEAKRRVSEGVLGQVFQVATRRLSHFPARISDVGVALDLASHDIDITSWLCDAPYTWVASASMSRSPGSGEDSVVVSAVLRGGIVASHVVNWLSPFKERTTVITGERGAFVVDSLTSDLTLYENGSVSSEWEYLANFRGVSEGDVTRLSFPKPEPLRAEHEAFRDAVLGLSNNYVSLESALETVRVVEWIVESAERSAAIACQHVRPPE